MTIDIKAMLHRVVAEVFDNSYVVEDVEYSDASWLHGVHVSCSADKDRTAIIRASYEWFDAFVPELNVQTSLFDYDDVEAEKEDELRKLCRAMRAYLRGEGRVEWRRRFLRRGTVPVLKIEVDGFKWSIGRYLSSGPGQ
ncbi:hypothetical protein IWX64_002661 [Arthrobacter sp. CAN_A212]|uniref:hypothetical protein n=1 Tax=Arthrobacter sp. CAN_A212 TaxID=2787719 RepID=UPI0018C9D8D0